MEFEHVTFDLPHGTFHALQPGDPDGQLVRTTGFAGVHPRKSALVLNIRLDRPVEDQRLLKAERVSATRYHNELKLGGPDDVDAQVDAWLREAYDLAR